MNLLDSVPPPTAERNVYAVVYVEGAPEPVFRGFTKLALADEKTLRLFLWTMFPQIRKIAVAVLGTPTRSLPDFLRQSGGTFLFSAQEKKVLAQAELLRKEIEAQKDFPPPEDLALPKPVRRHSKRVAPKKRKPKAVSKRKKDPSKRPVGVRKPKTKASIRKKRRK